MKKIKRMFIKVQEFEDINVQVGTSHGVPIMHTIPAEDQREWVEMGYGTIDELVSIETMNYRDWQSDC